MRTRLVDSYTDLTTGIVYGLRGDPTDFSLSQLYTHEHVQAVSRIFLTSGLAQTETSGFDYTLAGGLSLSIAAGQAFDAAGNYYETVSDPEGQPTVVTLDPADPTSPRIDLVYILLEQDVQAEPLPRTFKRLLTPSELAAGAAEYTPTNITVFAEKQTRATVRVHKGTPAASPAAPALGAGEVALFQVRVNANAATLVSGNVTDVRYRARSLAQAWAQIDANTGALVPATETAAGLMSAADKTKLDGVAAGAQVNVLESVSGNGPISVSAVTGKNQAISIAAATGSAAGSMSAADKAKLDAATANDTASTLAMRDSSGNVRHNEARVDSGVRYMADNSFRRSAFVREDFIPLIEVNSPVGFHGAATGVYEEVKRAAAASVPNSSTSTASVNVAPTFDVYLDPADYAGVSLKLEAYALHTATQPPVNAGNVWGSDLQLWNATDGVELAVLSWTWLEVALNSDNSKRSALFTITGSGPKRIVIRARNNTDNSNALFEIWRARLIINPSF